VPQQLDTLTVRKCWKQFPSVTICRDRFPCSLNVCTEITNILLGTFLEFRTKVIQYAMYKLDTRREPNALDSSNMYLKLLTVVHVYPDYSNVSEWQQCITGACYFLQSEKVFELIFIILTRCVHRSYRTTKYCIIITIIVWHSGT
jgi:hypothetical protein